MQQRGGRETGTTRDVEVSQTRTFGTENAHVTFVHTAYARYLQRLEGGRVRQETRQGRWSKGGTTCRRGKGRAVFCGSDAVWKGRPLLQRTCQVDAGESSYAAERVGSGGVDDQAQALPVEPGAEPLGVKGRRQRSDAVDEAVDPIG